MSFKKMMNLIVGIVFFLAAVVALLEYFDINPFRGTPKEDLNSAANIEASSTDVVDSVVNQSSGVTVRTVTTPTIRNVVETYNVSSENQIGGITAGKVELNTTAEYEVKNHTVKKLDNGNYQVAVTVTANKEDNLPAYFCLKVETDSTVFYNGQSYLYPVDSNNSMATSYDGGEANVLCIQNPSSPNIIGLYLVDRAPNVFNVRVVK